MGYSGNSLWLGEETVEGPCSALLSLWCLCWKCRVRALQGQGDPPTSDLPPLASAPRQQAPLQPLSETVDHGRTRPSFWEAAGTLLRTGAPLPSPWFSNLITFPRSTVQAKPCSFHSGLAEPGSSGPGPLLNGQALLHQGSGPGASGQPQCLHIVTAPGLLTLCPLTHTNSPGPPSPCKAPSALETVPIP